MKNPVAKHLHKASRPSVEPNKKRQELSSRVAWINQENALDTCFMQEEWHNELIDELDAREDV